MNFKKTLIILSLVTCGLNSYASLFDESLSQTRKDTLDSYNVQREIARENNDLYAQQRLYNNIDSHRRDIASNYRNSAPPSYRYR